MRKHICKMLLYKEHIIMLKLKWKQIIMVMISDLLIRYLQRRCLHLASIRKPYFIYFRLKFFAKVICNTKYFGNFVFVNHRYTNSKLLIINYIIIKHNEITNFFEYYSYPDFRLNIFSHAFVYIKIDI